MTIDAAGLQLLLTWMSPAFPTGAFAYSHGLEWAIDSGTVRDGPGLTAWIGDLIAQGSGWNDAVLFAQAWEGDAAALNELALALASSRERFLETTQVGRAFAIAADVFLAFPMAEKHQDLAYPIAAALACRAAGIAREAAVLAFLQGFAHTLTSVAVRLVPLGQTQGLHTIRALMPVIAATATRAAAASLDDLGAITIASDIAAMHHETLNLRVFRT